MTEQKYNLTLLPWLRLCSPVTALGVHFLPYSGTTVPSQFQSFSSEIGRILSSYRDVVGHPVAECVLGSIRDGDPCKELSEAEAFRVNEAVQLLAFSGIANNQYYTQLGHYTNSAAFQVFFQGFIAGSDEITLVVRRRDGRMRNAGYRHAQVKFSIPIQCAHFDPCRVDAALLEALEMCFQTADAQTRRLLQAISLFNQAHTDSDAVLPEREIILLASAFEQLFANCNGAEDLACKVSTLLDSYGAIKVADSARSNQIELSKGRQSQEQAWFLHRKCVQELYHLRNDFTHGNDPARRSWGWSVLEHLVMASFVFPLLVKILFAAKSKYSLTREDTIGPSAPMTDFLRHSTEPDVIRLEVIDRLLNETDWGAVIGNHSKWTEVIQTYTNNRSRERRRNLFLAQWSEADNDSLEAE